MAHYNIRSLRDKSIALEASILDVIPEVEVLCLMEHWLCNYDLNHKFIQHFAVADCYIRTGTVGGGSLIMVRDSIKFEPVDLSPFSSDLHCEISATRLIDLKTTVVKGGLWITEGSRQYLFHG